MNKSTPGAGKMLAMAGFALSCFGLLLFLWLSFGGPVPLKPRGYQVKASFPEATQLAEQADVRVAGVSIGKVVKKEPDPDGNRLLATIEIDREFAPVRADARAILRQKTLLGETYVEMTTGTKNAPLVKENGRLANAQVAETTQLDEVLATFPEETREDFRKWQADAARVIEGRGRDFNDALGNLGPFAEDGADLLTVLDRRREHLGALVREGGSVFEALTRDEDQLRAFIADSATWLEATASEKENLAEAIKIMPTFLDESKSTLTRLERFAKDTDPLVLELRPALQDLQPALADLRRTSAPLRATFRGLDPVVGASEQGLPALGRFLNGLEPVLAQTGPFLSQLNPILQFLELNQGKVSDFLSIGPSALAGIRSTTNPNGTGHVLPQIIVTGSQSIITPTRSSDNRGNTYFAPDALRLDKLPPNTFVPPNWDCNHVGEKQADDTPGCFVQGPIPFQGKSTRFPRVEPTMGR